MTRAVESSHSFNAAVAELMKLSNTLQAAPLDLRNTEVYVEGLRILLALMAPMAPCITAELWQAMAALPRGSLAFQPANNVHAQRWPIVDPTALLQPEIAVKIQIGGKFRGIIQVPSQALKSHKLLEESVLASPEFHQMTQRYNSPCLKKQFL